jgi:hypothetical protein
MNNRKSQWIALGVALGAGIGAALGVATHQMGAWLPIGTGVGIAIASALADRKSGVCESPRSQKRVSSASS